MNVIQKPTVLLERSPYRYIQVGTLCDNELQLMTAMEDYEYTRWLDPDGVPCYVRDSVSSEN